MNQHLRQAENISFPSDTCLHDLFRRQAERCPDATALVFKNKSITYQELDRRSDQIAARLIQLGIQPEDFVALYLERSLELIIGIFGILKAGGAYVPIDVDYPKDRMAFMLQDAQAKAVLTQKHLKNSLPKTPANLIVLDEQPATNNQQPATSNQQPTTSNHLAYMIYTSGSTGRPKGVMISHENVCNQLEGQQAIAPAPIDVMMLTCSISFDVSVLTIFWTLLQGATLVIPEQGEEKDIAKLAETIFKNKVSHILTLPSLYTLLLEQAPSHKLQSIKLVNVSGEVCPVSLAQKHEQIIPNGQLYNLYGPTEATVNCTYFTFPKGYAAAKAPIGIPILNYQIFILNEKMEEVPKGEIGEIYIGGTKPVIARGYWNRPKLTAERFVKSPFVSTSKNPSKGTAQTPPSLGSLSRHIGKAERGLPLPSNPKNPSKRTAQTPPPLGSPSRSIGKAERGLPLPSNPKNPSKGTAQTPPPLGGGGGGLYRTGDLARLLPDGNIEFLGRSDFQVKYRGFRIELGEVETAISNHPAIKETVVLLKNQHEVNNQKLVAYLTVNQGFTATVSELREHLSTSLPEYMLPSNFVFLEKMPLTTNGKFDRQALPEPTNERPALAEGYEAPETETESYVTKIWESILQVAPIGRNDKFFELGGTSIQAAKFIGRLMTELDTSIFITTIFDYPTVATYTRFLEKNYPKPSKILEKKSIELVSQAEGAESDSSLPFLTPEKIADFKNIIPIHLRPVHSPQSTVHSLERSGNPELTSGPQSIGLDPRSPIFIIAPPRSGTTLLRVMLAGHPGLFACNELQLLHFETLADRGASYVGKFALWTEGLVRAIMELKKMDADEAKGLLQAFEKQGMTTFEMFNQLQEWSGNKILVDKSPSYALDPLALQKAENDFRNARYIHLVRHPYSMVRSFEKYHMEQVLYLNGHDYTPQELGELVWLQSHLNTLDFLKNIPASRKCRIRYEDLVLDPEKEMRRMCAELNLPFHQNLLNPYQDLDKKMTDGLYQNSRSMGDANFDKQQKINAKKAEDWKGVLNDNFLCKDTWQLTQQLGYQPFEAMPLRGGSGWKGVASNGGSPDNSKERPEQPRFEAMPLRGEGGWKGVASNGDRPNNSKERPEQPRFEAMPLRGEGGWKGVASNGGRLDKHKKRPEQLHFEATGKGELDPQKTISKPSPQMDHNHSTIQPSNHSNIAIIGMSCRFPGANTLDEFWQNLIEAKDVSRKVTPEDLRQEGEETAKPANYIWKTYALDDPYCFDASFFGYHPKEAAMMDPQHRVFLETAYEALESAGYDPFKFDGKIGVFGGVARNTYFTKNISKNEKLLQEAGGYQEMLAAESSFSISRVAYKLNLKGPAVNVQTACSTGGVAIHLACQSLMSGDSEMVIVGGGRIQSPVNGGYEYVEGGPLSPDGTCRAFDASANGMVQGNGMGMLVLKRLDQAQKDGDHIWATIRSTAINNDGADKTGITAPSRKGQADCIAEAIERAGLTAAQIGYFETHGTGTFIGDPIEIQGLTDAVSRSSIPGKTPIGSVKTNIGHLDAGACIAGIIKTALSLKNEMLPPTMHFEQPNPQLDLDNSPFYINKKVQPWLTGREPRRAGVSSFGLGGTNAHIILEEAPEVSPQSTVLSPQSVWSKPGLLIFSGKTEEAVEQMVGDFEKYFAENEALNIADAAYTLAAGRPKFKKRKALIFGSNNKRVAINNQQPTTNNQFVFMFPGGGSQYEDMAKDLYEANLFFKKQVDVCFEILKSKHDLDVKGVVFPNAGSMITDHRSLITKPSFALASLFTIEYSLAKLWQHWGIEPAEMIGHSMGEYTAACLAGVMTLEEALGLVTVRGKLFETLDGGGCMLSIATTESNLAPMLDSDHTISVINKSDSLVVSSTQKGIERLKAKLDKKGIDNALIHISVPAHSPLIEPILDEFKKYLQTVDFQKPKLPFISNVTGTWISPKEATDPDYWIKHIRQTVRFADGLNTLMHPSTVHRPPSTVSKNRIFLEVGPGQTLSSFARAFPTLNGEKRLVLASVRHPKEQADDVEFIYRSVGKLWVNGKDIDWQNFYEGDRKRIPLPTYPFEKKKYFIAAKRSAELPFSDVSEQEFGATKTLDPTMSNQSRIPILIKEIKESLHELSGMEPADMEAEATFLELGFDSLFLSQAVIKFNYKFKLKLSFRMLFEEAPTVEALAEYIDGEIPEELFRPSVSDASKASDTSALASNIKVVPVQVSDALKSSGTGLANPNQQITNLLQQQLNIMQQQIDLLRGGAASNPDGNRGRTSNPDGNRGRTSNPDGNRGIKSQIKRKTKGVTAKMGNYKKIGSSDDLSQKQQQALADFISRYNALTKTSKEMAERHRLYYADPRGVTGFSKLWKEICYQIAHEKSKGARIWDVDGNEYIDYVMSYGVALFGHMPDFVEEAVIEAVRKGNSIDLLPPQATEIARIICEITGYDRATLSNTGTEAVLGAVRAARTATGRDRIAVFDTDYHGMVDQFLVRGIHLRGESKTLPSSAGIPKFLVENTLTLDYDDPEVLQKLENEIAELAAVVIEPVQAQNPHWQHRELIQKIRQLTEKHDVVLIFDEIINGFRMDRRGAQGWYGVDADISAYGKSISGGLPLAAVAGKAKYMDAFDGGQWKYGDDSSPDGVITYFASTFIKNPISVAAGYAAMKEIERLGPALQADLNEKTIRFAERIREIFLRSKAPLMIQCASSFFMIKYADGSPLNRLFHYFLRARGINVRERPCFISTAHTEADFEKTYEAFELAIADMFEADLFQAYEGEDLNVIVSQSSVRQSTVRQSSVRQSAVLSPTVGSLKLEEGQGFQYPIPNTQYQVPLTEGQQEIFLSDQISPEASKAYNIATEIRLEGKLDVERMKAALQALVARHEALRTVINADGKTQTILPELEIEIPVVDWRVDNPPEGRVVNSLEQLYHEEAEHLFDLQNGPLVRFKIILLENELSLVFIHVHHIICDGWSLGILTRELGEMYGSDLSLLNLKGLVNLKTLETPKQLSQYATEQAGLQQLDLYQENEKYWLNEFADGVPVLNLPTDFHRPPVKTYPGAVEKISFGPAFVKQLRKAAAKQGSTFYVFLLAAYQAYLGRITGQDDFVIGVAAAGHNLPGNQNLVAHAIGLLPVRTKIGAGISFKKYLKEVRGKVLDAFDHQQFTYGSLLKKLKMQRSSDRSTMVSVAFNLDSPLDDLFFGKLQASTKAIPRHYETFDSFINLKPLGEGVDFEWNFNTDLFQKESIRLRLKEFKQFLQSILVEAEKPIAELLLLPDFERQQIAAFGQGEKVEFPLHLCLHQLFEQQAKKTPDKVAVTMSAPPEHAPNNGHDSHLTYRQLNNKADALAAVLIEKGLQPGDFVGLCMERSLDMMVGIYGILKAGGAYVPIDPKNPEERIGFMLEDAGCQVLVTQEALLETLPEYGGMIVFAGGTAEMNSSASRRMPKVAGSVSDPGSLITDDQSLTTKPPAYIIYTSGSTGTPKGVVVRHENAVNTLFAINRYLEISGEDTVYSVSSMSFDMSIPDYFLTLMQGATLVLADEATKKDGFALRTAIEVYRPTFMQATPTTWKILFLSGWQGDANLKAVAGGEAFSKKLAAQMAACCKAVWNGYGPTETTIYATYQRVTEEHLARCPGEHVAIGSPIANVEMQVLDKNKQPVPIGVPGELYIGGKGVSSGYLNRAELTEEKFLHLSPLPINSNSETALTPPPLGSQSRFVGRAGGGLYRTGDLVRYLPTTCPEHSGGEIEFLGRIDKQVKIRGFRIELGEIEECIKKHETVEQCAVNVFEDQTGSHQLAAYFVLSKGFPSGKNGISGENLAEELKAFLRKQLPGFMVPAYFTEMKALPMNSSLKVDRKALPEPQLSNLPKAKKEIASTKGEQLLTGIWQELLGLKEVSVQDDFFDLGGHSLAAVQLMTRIKELTGKKLPLTTLFQHSTIKKLASQLNGFNKPLQNGTSSDGSKDAGFVSLICIQKGGDKTPLYLVHGGGLHVLFYQNMVKYLDKDQPIYALQARGLNGDVPPLDRIEDMAAHYIREIKMQNPEGPYCLAGYSLGGLIAWEMAAQLKAENKEVPLLSLFDAVAKYEWAGTGNSGNLKKKMKKIGFNLSLLLKEPGKAIEYKSSVLKMQFQHMKGKLQMAYRNNKTNEIEEGFLPFGKEVYEKSIEAYEHYELKPLNIHVDLFKAIDQMFYLHDPENYGWDRFALEGLTVHKIAGNHLTLFDEPHGKEVAEALKKRLEEVGQKIEIT
ncbi:MAG TPA: amino acid adenylation domain-containing protein [Bacteroidetes bacterium]|nr:amino acid adenylation domain-containing protein [Bacteroidota bacterium]